MKPNMLDMSKFRDVGKDVMVEVCKVGPAEASKWLQHNARNRSLSKSHVTFLAKQMADGAWMLNGQAIIISHDDEVLDGQHRLHAIIESGSAVETLVVYGISQEAFRTIDTGKARTPADVVKLNYPDATAGLTATVSTAAYRSILMDAHVWHRNAKISNTEVLDYVHSNPVLFRLGEQSISLGGKPSIISHGVGTALWHQFHKKSQGKAEEFMTAFWTGEELRSTHPAYVVRHQLIQDKQRRAQWDTITRMKMVIKAWNLFRAGKAAHKNATNLRTSDPNWIPIK